jgi:hypothetical protein
VGIRSSRDVRRADRFGVLDRGVLSEVSTEDSGGGRPRARLAVNPVLRQSARCLGVGIGGLVNMLDPAVAVPSRRRGVSESGQLAHPCWPRALHRGNTEDRPFPGDDPGTARPARGNGAERSAPVSYRWQPCEEGPL